LNHSKQSDAIQTFTGLYDRFLKRLQDLDSVLLHKTFLVGERITLADVFVVTSLTNAFTGLVDAAAREKLPNLVRYVDS
jgi:elongation factor 1-gamma